jgi:hypothetical protein
MTHKNLLCAVIGTLPMLVLPACQRSNADEEAKAVRAQHEADDKIAKSQREADQKAAEAQRKADDQTMAARSEANKDEAQARTNANGVVRSANETIRQAQNDLRSWVQKQLDSLDGDIDKSKTKAQTANAKEKADFERRLGDVEAKRKVVAGELATIDAATGSELDQVKARVQKEVDAFSASVSRLKATL